MYLIINNCENIQWKIYDDLYKACLAMSQLHLTCQYCLNLHYLFKISPVESKHIKALPLAHDFVKKILHDRTPLEWRKEFEKAKKQRMRQENEKKFNSIFGVSK